jgi:drug/metabolite transporter superfamily protein YnfA
MAAYGGMYVAVFAILFAKSIDVSACAAAVFV